MNRAESADNDQLNLSADSKL